MNRDKAPSPAGASKRRAVVIFLAVLLAAALAVIACLPRLPNKLDRAKAAYDRRDFASAAHLVDSLLREQASNEALLLGARLAAIQQRPDEAIGLLRRISDDGGVEGVETLVECGKMCGQLGWLGDAERYLRLVLGHAPQHAEANDRLFELMRIQGRNWEAYELAANIFPVPHYRLEQLEVLGTLKKVWITPEADGDFLAHCEAVAAEDPRTQLGIMQLVLEKQHEVERAKQALLKAVATAPELLEAQAVLGEFLLDNGDDREFYEWLSKLPASADRHPTIWVVRGRWLHRQGDTEGAMRCLWEAIKRFPHDSAPNLLLAKLLTSVGRERDAAPFQRRGDLLVTFEQLLLTGGRGVETLVQMVELLETLERRREAIGWCRILLQTDPNSEFAFETISRLDRQMGSMREATASANPALAIDLASYPLPDWQSYEATASTLADSASATALSFHDSASEVALDFSHFIEQERLKTTVYTFDVNGGGVGVMDYDGDGWADIYLTQSGHWPTRQDEAEPCNGLFRNVGGRFVDVAALAHVADKGFGQGPAVGDFNSDGFPDLYVTNLGANVFYMNNGDGTFQDITETTGTAGDDNWFSAALADFSGDGLPDLYVVNYLEGATEQPCQGGGKPIGCGPHLLPGQPDRLYLNLGSGKFRDISDEAGVSLPEGPGKGLGLLVADFDQQDGLDIYVANDMTANRLYLNQGASAGSLAFVEQGRIAGVAYDATGTMQGSMGIAAADLEQDGLLDVFVSNFFHERNNLFSQLASKPNLLFSDRGSESNLAPSSVNEVGWGAQFLDAELDGDWDLFVANGDINENTAVVGKMFPRMFENVGAGRFEPRSEAGDFFQIKTYGRAAARLDWNRDGLDDLCVTHRAGKTALLTNTSRRRGHFIALELKGVECSRDAVGAVVEVEAGAQRWSVQLMTGDGFSATNQKQILLGLGAATEVDRLTIRWPGGDPQSFENLPADRQWIIVQGRDSPIPQVLDVPVSLH